jgi:hypothetical protein
MTADSKLTCERSGGVESLSLASSSLRIVCELVLAVHHGDRPSVSPKSKGVVQPANGNDCAVVPDRVLVARFSSCLDEISLFQRHDD